MARGAYPWGITLTLYADRDTADSKQPTSFPRLIPLHLTPWYFGMEFQGNEIDENGVETGAEWWWKVVQTTFRLMQQRIAHKGFHRPDRASHREGAKLGLPDDNEIVVVRLRREAGEGNEPSGNEAHYSHRFMVTGSLAQPVVRESKRSTARSGSAPTSRGRKIAHSSSGPGACTSGKDDARCGNEKGGVIDPAPSPVIFGAVDPSKMDVA